LAAMVRNSLAWHSRKHCDMANHCNIELLFICLQ
jgi:hypothetical protein